jgi:hypothetical protein
VLCRQKGDETWLMEVYRVPTALRGELIPVLIHDHEVDAGTLVCLRTSSDDSRRLIGIREGELRGWTGTIGGLLVAHGLGCLASNRSKLHFSSVPPSCTPNLILSFCMISIRSSSTWTLAAPSSAIFTIRVHRKPTEWCGVREFVMRLESILDTLKGRDLSRRSRKFPQQGESGPTSERVGRALTFGRR